MPELPDLEDIIKSNPDVDPKKLREARKLHRLLQEKRAEGGRYRIASPMDRHRASVIEANDV